MALPAIRRGQKGGVLDADTRVLIVNEETDEVDGKETRRVNARLFRTRPARYTYAAWRTR